jgi:hypothetical protein
MNEKKDTPAERKWNLVGWIGKWLIDVVCMTLQIRVVDFDRAARVIETEKYIFAFWHSRIVVISYLYKGQGTAILVSSSKDGEIIARILQKQGHRTIRGSTSRHGARALARLVKVIRLENRPGVVVPDGPRGPRFQVQPGVIALAKKTGRAIVPITYSCKKAKVFSSWDRFILPCPFSKCIVMYGTPLFVPGDIEANTQEVYRRRLEDELNRITKTVDAYFDRTVNGST